MKHVITQEPYTADHSRTVRILIDGYSRVTVSQELKSPVDFKPQAPSLHWSAPGDVDADYAEAMADALRTGAEIFRMWEAELMKTAA